MDTNTLHSQHDGLKGIWERYVGQDAGVGDRKTRSGVLRAEIAQSWERSRYLVDPGAVAAPVDESTVNRWNDSPLRRPITEMTAELRQIADSAGFVVGVSDEFGTLLWTCGSRTMRRQAEQVNFAVGGRWDESVVGTNALGLALRTGQPSTVFAAEHLVECLHGWVCYCAPIRDASQRIVGVIDLSTTWEHANPLALSTVNALSGLIEARLREWDRGPLRLRDNRISIRCLGAMEASRGSDELRLTPRQAEILALLALRPDGYSPGELSVELYGDRCVSTATLKAEISHLRRLMGGIISRNRYALSTEISCDAVEVLSALKGGDITTAIAKYRGPLLPDSEAPGVVSWRERLSVAVREAVLRDQSPESALMLGDRCHDDPAIFEHALAKLSPTDCRRPFVVGHLRTALRGWS